jgi:CMP/dCMP kinase
MIVTVDGPAGAGKSTAARRLAELLGFRYLDTGAMFRAFTVRALDHCIAFEDEESLVGCVDAGQLEMREDSRVLMDSVDVTERIRDPAVTPKIRYLANNPKVRLRLLEQQRKMGEQWENMVCDGRDTGTVVFPNAQLKIFLSASIEVRADRRLKELLGNAENDINVPQIEDLKQQIADRDHSDRTRDVAPLAQADDAILIDCSDLNREQTLQAMMQLVKERQTA